MLAVPRAVYDAVVAHAVEAAPEEACGVIGGEFEERRSTVRAVRRATNAADAPRHEYAIDPAEQLALHDELEAAGHDVVGFYHSHPRGPAGPSGTDVERATWPDRSYVIVDLAGEHPFVGAWRWDGAAERFVREVLDVA
ncbi:MAG: desampylase [Halobacteriales archaeon]